MSKRNHLLHELKIKDHGGVVAVCEKAGMWHPHIYACLRNEKIISLTLLERLGDALDMELVWRKKRKTKDVSEVQDGVYDIGRDGVPPAQ